MLATVKQIMFITLLKVYYCFFQIIFLKTESEDSRSVDAKLRMREVHLQEEDVGLLQYCRSCIVETESQSLEDAYKAGTQSLKLHGRLSDLQPVSNAYFMKSAGLQEEEPGEESVICTLLSSCVTTAIVITACVVILYSFACSWLLKRSRSHLEVYMKEKQPEGKDVDQLPYIDKENEMWLCKSQQVRVRNQTNRVLTGKQEKERSFFPELEPYINFPRQRQFPQMLTVCPAQVNLVSHFASGTYGHPGGTQELQKEGVRLASFKNFPTSTPVSALRLAQAGFYSMGERDQVSIT